MSSSLLPVGGRPPPGRDRALDGALYDGGDRADVPPTPRADPSPPPPGEVTVSPLLIDKTLDMPPVPDSYLATASPWSRLVFGWFRPLLELGKAKGRLDPEDLTAIPMPDDCVTSNVMSEFDLRWEEERPRSNAGGAEGSAEGGGGGWMSSSSASAASVSASAGAAEKGGPSLFRALARAFGWEFVKAGALKLVHDACIFVGPAVLNGLIYYLRDADAPLWHGLGLTAAVTASQLAMSLCLRHYFFGCYLTGLRVRTAVVTAVYRKALALSSSERQVRSAGEVVNLVSVDAQRLQDLTTYLHAVWYSFVQMGLAIYFLWLQLGPSCLGGVAVIVIMIPVTKAIAGWLGRLQKDLMKSKDSRVDVNNEVLGSMRVVKFQAWEESFRDRINELRNNELDRMWTYKMVGSLSMMLWSAVPLLVALATFAAYTLAGNDLDVASALTALALFDILRFPLFMLPQIINRIVEAGVSFARVRTFLLCREHGPVGPPPEGGRYGSEPGIWIEGDATFVYDGKKPRFDDGEESTTKKSKKKRQKKGGPSVAIRRELHDSRWELTLLRSRLADAEGRIRELAAKGRGGSSSGGYGSVDSATDGTDFGGGGGGGGGDGAGGEGEGGADPPEDGTDPAELLSLRRIGLSCGRGELIAVVGGVGSGKSTLLQAILGEVRPVCGSLSVRGRLAYFSQTPFVMNDTLRNNVLFGRRDEPFDYDRYGRSIEACALRHDLALLPHGDSTEIGEKGITLSGGQKARVAMARALYHDADIYLLDDPLSAVDAHVGKHMFQRCVVGEMLLGGNAEGGGGRQGRKSTVVLVTNAIQYLSSPMVDRIIVLRDGAIAERGTYSSLSKDPQSLFSSFLAVMAETGGGAYGETSTESPDSEPGGAEGGDESSLCLPSTPSANSMSALSDVDEPEVSRICMPKRELEDRMSTGGAISGRGGGGDDGGEWEAENGDGAAVAAPSPGRRSSPGSRRRGGRRSRRSVASSPPAAGAAGADGQPTASAALMTDEFRERETGGVTPEVYLSYARAAGGPIVAVIIVLSFGAVEGINVLSKWWLTHWSQNGGDFNSQMGFLGVYAAINLTAVLAAFGRLLFIVLCGLRASRKIFSRLLEVVLEAPMSFFDTTPIGRIVNRFSKDMYTIDEQLVSTLRSYLGTVTAVIGVIVVVSSITPWFTLCLAPIMVFYVMQQNYFTRTYRELKRLDSVSRSPIYALLGETLDGVSTIRAYSAESALLARVMSMLDSQQTAYFLTCAAQCWLAVRLEMAGTLIVCFACLCAVSQHGSRGGDESFAGLAGLSVSFALTVTQSLNWSVRMGSDLEANFVAAERVGQYSRIPPEAPRVTEADEDVDPKWPERGEIRFRGVKMRYRPGLPLVLKGLDLDIPAGSKVGIVGRTGAGKSTLMVALLRIVELDGGTICIDGVDVRTLGLKKLRKQIAVIPQDPVLFSGTVRTNLDPFDEYSDERLYEVLSRVGLYGTTVARKSSSMSLASSASGGGGGGGGAGRSHGVRSLSDDVAEGGSNFSVGQRQLLVIARALLRGARVVVMDEATASVDADTDARIQGVMRTEFRGSTCLTVAHRINTILDSDYVLVMDDGRAAEFDAPGALLARGGLFRDLVDAWEREHDGE